MKIWGKVIIVLAIVGVLSAIGIAINEYASVKAENAALTGQLQVAKDNFDTLNETLGHTTEALRDLDETMHASNRLSVDKLDALYAQLTAQQTDLKKLKELAEHDKATNDFLRNNFPRAVYCFMFPRSCPTDYRENENTAGDSAGATAPAVQGTGEGS